MNSSADADDNDLLSIEVIELAPFPHLIFLADGPLVYRNKAAIDTFGPDAFLPTGDLSNNIALQRGLDRARRSSIPTRFRIEHDEKVFVFDAWRASRHEIGVPVYIAVTCGRPTNNLPDKLTMAASLKKSQEERERARRRIAQLKTEAAHLRKLANTDGLTNLLTARAFKEALVRLPVLRGCLFYIDLDKFKSINDTFGHSAGDAVLAHVAQALLLCSRTNDLVARLGGDEFAFWAQDMPEGSAGTAARRIEESIARPVTVRDTTQKAVTVVPTASIGVSAAYGLQTIDEMLSDADFDMYQKKSKTRQMIIQGPTLADRIDTGRA